MNRRLDKNSKTSFNVLLWLNVDTSRIYRNIRFIIQLKFMFTLKHSGNKMQIIFAWRISPWKISKLKKPGIYQNPLVLRCRRQIHSNVIDKEMLIIVKRDCKTLVVNNNCNKWNYVTFLNISWPGYKNLQHKIRRRINFKWIMTTCHVIYIPFSLSYMAKKRRF